MGDEPAGRRRAAPSADDTPTDHAPQNEAAEGAAAAQLQGQSCRHAANGSLAVGRSLVMLAAINWHSFLFLLSGGLACAFALGVLFSSNIVRMAFYLIVSLAATAGLFILAGATFVGAMQIMIYVGGTLVLLMFGVMLTAQAAFVSLKTQAATGCSHRSSAALLLALLLATAVAVPEWRSPQPRSDFRDAESTDDAASLGWGLIGVRVDKTRASK